jgi:hypothetical protein
MHRIRGTIFAMFRRVALAACIGSMSCAGDGPRSREAGEPPNSAADTQSTSPHTPNTTADTAAASAPPPDASTSPWHALAKRLKSTEPDLSARVQAIVPAETGWALVVAASSDGKKLFLDPFPIACGLEPRRLQRLDVANARTTTLFTDCEECSEVEEERFRARVKQSVGTAQPAKDLITSVSFAAAAATMVRPLVVLAAPGDAVDGNLIDAAAVDGKIAVRLLDREAKPIATLGQIRIKQKCTGAGASKTCKVWDSPSITDVFRSPDATRLVAVVAMFHAQGHCGDPEIHALETRVPPPVVR